MTTLVQMTVDGSNYYISDSGFVGENFWHPFLLTNPVIRYTGEGWIKAETGKLVLARDPSNANHPFSYSSGNFATMLSSPSTQYTVKINYDDEDMADGKTLWDGIAIFSSISTESIEFNLLQSQPSETFQSQFIGKFPIYAIDNATQTTFEVYAVNATPTKFKKGDQVLIKAKIESGYNIDGLSPETVATVVEDASFSRSSPYTLWNIKTDVDRSAFSTQLLNIEIAAVSSPFFSRFPVNAAPTWYIHKILPSQQVFMSDKSFKREIPEERHMKEGYDGKDWVVMPSNISSAPSVSFFQDGDSITATNTELYGGASTDFKFRKSDGSDYDGTITFELSSGSAQFTINDVAENKLGTIDITKAPNADDDNLFAIDLLINNERKYEFIDRIAQSINYQFFKGFTESVLSPFDGGVISKFSVADDPFEIGGDTTLSADLIIGGGVQETVFLIDRANSPGTTSISDEEIISVRYENPFPTQKVQAQMTQFEEVGSSSNNNYAFYSDSFTLNSFNSDTQMGRTEQVEQMADRIAAQQNYLDAILNSKKKSKVSVRIDSVNRTIKPGDNLTFTERDAPVTVSSLLVRGITYDLQQEETTFFGEATITTIEVE